MPASSLPPIPVSSSSSTNPPPPLKQALRHTLGWAEQQLAATWSTTVEGGAASRRSWTGCLSRSRIGAVLATPSVPPPRVPPCLAHLAAAGSKPRLQFVLDGGGARAAAPIRRLWWRSDGSSSNMFAPLSPVHPSPTGRRRSSGPCHEKEAVRDLRPLPCSATLATGHGDGGGGAHAAFVRAFVLSIGRFGHDESQTTP